MRVIIFGAHGLLGGYLSQAFSSEQVFAWDQESLDITDREAVLDQCEGVEPDVIINAAAYNAVDEAETSEEASRRAFLVNAHAVNRLAEVAIKTNALFVHFSTDYVFDGEKGGAYRETDETNPLSAYGRSKREGEEMILRMNEKNLAYHLIRTSRLFGRAVSENSKVTFPDLVLDMAAEKTSLEFIDGSEIASPTYAKDLAEAVYDMIIKKVPSGIYHRTNSGSCSWFGFAEEVLRLSDDYTTDENEKGKKFIELTPVAVSDVPRPAQRPSYSTLESTKLPPLRPWQEALEEYLRAND